MPLTVLYLASLREQVGIADEQVDPPAYIATVADLVRLLVARGGVYVEAFRDVSRLRVAVDLNHVGFDAAILGAREVAFFPPVTGG